MRLRRAHRGAFTIVEMVVALIVTLAIAAVVLPTVTGRGDEIAHTESVESVRSTLASARLEAMREGEAVSLVAVVSANGRTIEVVSRRGEPGPLDASGTGGPAPAQDAARGVNAFSLEDAFGGPEGEVGEVIWRARSGVAFVREIDLQHFRDALEPTGEADPFGPTRDVPEWGAADEFDPAGGPTRVRELNLATFLPGGQTSDGGFVVLGPGERASRVTVSPWTGRVEIERLKLRTEDDDERDLDTVEPPMPTPPARPSQGDPSQPLPATPEPAP